MCLVTKNIEGEISNEPIKCYKLYEQGVRKDEIFSPIIYACYNTKKDKVIYGEGDFTAIKKSEAFTDEWYLRAGYIHAYREKYRLFYASKLLRINCHEVVRLMKRTWDGDVAALVDMRLGEMLEMLDSYALYQMEIPAGERYWMGECCDICARKMVLKRRIKIRKKSELLKWIYEWERLS